MDHLVSDPAPIDLLQSHIELNGLNRFFSLAWIAKAIRFDPRFGNDRMDGRLLDNQLAAVGCQSIIVLC